METPEDPKRTKQNPGIKTRGWQKGERLTADRIRSNNPAFSLLGNSASDYNLGFVQVSSSLQPSHPPGEASSRCSNNTIAATQRPEMKFIFTLQKLRDERTFSHCSDNKCKSALYQWAQSIKPTAKQQLPSEFFHLCCWLRRARSQEVQNNY